MAIDCIVCDWGKVLIDFDAKLTVRRLVKLSGIDPITVRNIVFQSQYTKENDLGISPQEFYERVSDLLGWQLKVKAEEFREAWDEMFSYTPENEKMVQLMSCLRGNGYRMVMLSNVDKSHAEYLQRNFSQTTEPFEHKIWSCNEGMRKPDKGLWQRVKEITGIPPERCAYIDDVEEYVRVARQLGMTGIWHKGYEQTARELMAAGIKI